jgi:hypothetical protein
VTSARFFSNGDASGKEKFITGEIAFFPRLSVRLVKWLLNFMNGLLCGIARAGFF